MPLDKSDPLEPEFCHFWEERNTWNLRLFLSLVRFQNLLPYPLFYIPINHHLQLMFLLKDHQQCVRSHPCSKSARSKADKQRRFLCLFLLTPVITIPVVFTVVALTIKNDAETADNPSVHDKNVNAGLTANLPIKRGNGIPVHAEFAR